MRRSLPLYRKKQHRLRNSSQAFVGGCSGLPLLAWRWQEIVFTSSNVYLKYLARCVEHAKGSERASVPRGRLSLDLRAALIQPPLPSLSTVTPPVEPTPFEFLCRVAGDPAEPLQVRRPDVFCGTAAACGCAGGDSSVLGEGGNPRLRGGNGGTGGLAFSSSTSPVDSAASLGAARAHSAGTEGKKRRRFAR